MAILSIGKVAKLAGIGVETVRFYERLGLIDQPQRSAAGYRQYPAEVVGRLGFIRQAKKLGFTLKEVGELLTLGNDPLATCTDIKQRAEVKLADIDERIAELEAIRAALAKLAGMCRPGQALGECPILKMMQG